MYKWQAVKKKSHAFLITGLDWLRWYHTLYFLYQNQIGGNGINGFQHLLCRSYVMFQNNVHFFYFSFQMQHPYWFKWKRKCSYRLQLFAWLPWFKLQCDPGRWSSTSQELLGTRHCSLTCKASGKLMVSCCCFYNGKR